MQPVFRQETANDLIREVQSLAQKVGQLEKRLDKYTSIAVFSRPSSNS
jgi:hypothetical protein